MLYQFMVSVDFSPLRIFRVYGNVRRRVLSHAPRISTIDHFWAGAGRANKPPPTIEETQHIVRTRAYSSLKHFFPPVGHDL